MPNSRYVNISVVTQIPSEHGKEPLYLTQVDGSLHAKDKISVGSNRLSVLPLTIALIVKNQYFYPHIRSEEAPLQACLKKRYSSAPGIHVGVHH